MWSFRSAVSPGIKEWMRSKVLKRACLYWAVPEEQNCQTQSRNERPATSWKMKTTGLWLCLIAHYWSILSIWFNLLKLFNQMCAQVRCYISTSYWFRHPTSPIKMSQLEKKKLGKRYINLSEWFDRKPQESKGGADKRKKRKGKGETSYNWDKRNFPRSHLDGFVLATFFFYCQRT